MISEADNSGHLIIHNIRESTILDSQESASRCSETKTSVTTCSLQYFKGLAQDPTYSIHMTLAQLCSRLRSVVTVFDMYSREMMKACDCLTGAFFRFHCPSFPSLWFIFDIETSHSRT